VSAVHAELPRCGIDVSQEMVKRQNLIISANLRCLRPKPRPRTFRVQTMAKQQVAARRREPFEGLRTLCITGQLP